MKVAEKYSKAVKNEMPMRVEVYEVTGDELELIARFNSRLDAINFATYMSNEYESVYVVMVGERTQAFYGGVEVSNEPAESF